MKNDIIKLFCIPHAGGSSMSYNQYQNMTSNFIDVQPIEFSGRGKRYRDMLYDNFEEAIEDIYSQIESTIQSSPYALYGHSMGSLFAYELFYRILKKGMKTPKHIFLSGCCPPHELVNRKKINILPDDEFLEEILSFGGIPEELVEKKYLKFFFPVLRNDIKIFESYSYVNKNIKLNCNITVLYANDDECTRGVNMEAWKEYTIRNCNFHMFDGGHFFNIEKDKEVTNIINSMLINYL